MLEQIKTLLDSLAHQNMPKISEIPPEIGRAAFSSMVALLEKPAPYLKRVEDRIIEGPNGPIPIRLYDPDPEDKSAKPLILFFHGGGFVLGDINNYESLTASIAERTGFPVISVEYRLAPENPFPKGLEDCLHSAKWATHTASQWLGRPVQGFIPMGDSAGGNLAAVVVQELHKTVPIVAQVLLYPVTDLARDHASRTKFGSGYLLEQREMEFFASCYLGENTDMKDPRISPIYGQGLSTLPKTIIVVAEYDPLHDEGLALSLIHI